MGAETPSRTAAWVAAARGMGALLPDLARLADDPYGLAFASPRLARIVDAARARGAGALVTLPGIGEWVLYMQVRTRLLDDAVRAFAAAGGPQLVAELPAALAAAGHDPARPTITLRERRDHVPQRGGHRRVGARRRRIQRAGLEAGLPAALARRVGDPESRVADALRESVAHSSSDGLSGGFGA
jgi:hypothetical protein